MEKEQVLLVLRSHAAELKASGLEHLSIFGSVARGQAGSQSDLDLLADFKASAQITLVSIGSLEHRLSRLLDANVEISSARWMREPVRTQALKEAILAF